MSAKCRLLSLSALLGWALSGCTSYVSGGEIRVQAQEVPKPAVREARAPRPLVLSSREPVYASPAPKDDWAPDLRPIRRAVWATGAPIAERLQPMGRIWRITVHHEGMPAPNFHTSLEDVVSDLRDIRKVHIRDMRAGDIGYHYVIDPAGRIWEGRPEKYQGAHAGGEANLGNLGIMLLGNFDLQKPSARQLKALEAFLRLLMARHRIAPDRVFTHRELKPTDCPGKVLQEHMNALRAKL